MVLYDKTGKFLKDIIQQYIDQSKSILPTLKEALLENNIVQAKTCLHKLEGSSSSLGATNFTKNIIRTRDALKDKSANRKCLFEILFSSFEKISSLMKKEYL